MQGVKYDSGKPRPSLLPFESLWEIVKVLEVGAKKYSIDNWKHVPGAEQRYKDALLRHAFAYMCGEDRDPDDGELTLAHIGCCVLFLLWFRLKRRPIVDEFGYPEEDKT